MGSTREGRVRLVVLEAVPGVLRRPGRAAEGRGNGRTPGDLAHDGGGARR